MTPKVKKLVWDDDNSASTPMGRYGILERYVYNDEDVYVFSRSEYPYPDESEYFPTLEAAKAAAQADFEERVLDCLEDN